MALNLEYPLTSSKGLSKVVYFEGLDFSILIAPTIHGEPLLTAQAFYYLEQLESIVKIRFNDMSSFPSDQSREDLERKIEYIIDNYLFAFSKKYPTSKLTSKITEYKYWKEDNYTYYGYDENNTKALALDMLNDPSIIDLKNEDFPSKDYWYDWRLISNYTSDYLSEYIKSMQSIINKKVNVVLNEHIDLGTGEYTLPLLDCAPGLLTYDQAMMLDVLSTDRVNTDSDQILISRGIPSNNNFLLDLEVFNVTKYHNADLLSYYFAGVREHLSISKFRSFYNVLEYFFEEAPLQIGETARIERDQISCVIRWVSNTIELYNFINSFGNEYISELETDLTSSSGVNITAISVSSDSLDADIARWLYDIRCACIHSKKTRRGVTSARLVPYSQDESLVQVSIPIIQYLAIKCIEIDSHMTTY